MDTPRQAVRTRRLEVGTIAVFAMAARRAIRIRFGALRGGGVIRDCVDSGREEVAIVERARRRSDARLEERAVAEARVEVDVEALIHVGFVPEVGREADQA